MKKKGNSKKLNGTWKLSINGWVKCKLYPIRLNGKFDPKTNSKIQFDRGAFFFVMNGLKYGNWSRKYKAVEAYNIWKRVNKDTKKWMKANDWI